jgi:hypothetical protein
LRDAGRRPVDALAKAEYMPLDEYGRTTGSGTSSLGDRRVMFSLSVGDSCVRGGMLAGWMQAAAAGTPAGDEFDRKSKWCGCGPACGPACRVSWRAARVDVAAGRGR